VELLLTDVTVMNSGYICVAGIDDFGNHYRPMLTGMHGGEWLRTSWHENNGIIQVRHLVEFGILEPCPHAPHVEDHRVVNSGEIRCAASLDRPDFWARLQSAVKDDPLAAMCGGAQTIDAKGRVTVPEGRGVRSLACARVSAFHLYVLDRSRYEKAPQLRARLKLGFEPELLDLPVNDIRLTSSDRSINEAVVEPTNEYAKNHSLLASVGLTRSIPSPHGPQHWLQVNGLHFGPRTAAFP